MIRMGSPAQVVEMNTSDIVRDILVEHFVLAIEEDENEKASKNTGSKC